MRTNPLAIALLAFDEILPHPVRDIYPDRRLRLLSWRSSVTSLTQLEGKRYPLYVLFFFFSERVNSCIDNERDYKGEDNNPV